MNRMAVKMKGGNAWLRIDCPERGNVQALISCRGWLAMFHRDRLRDSGTGEGAGGVDGAVGPEDFHRVCGREIAKAVRHVRGNPRGVEDSQDVHLVFEFQRGFAFQQGDAFFTIVAVEGNRGARVERCDSVDKLPSAQGRSNQWSGSSAGSAVIGFERFGPQENGCG